MILVTIYLLWLDYDDDDVGGPAEAPARLTNGDEHLLI